MISLSVSGPRSVLCHLLWLDRDLNLFCASFKSLISMFEEFLTQHSFLGEPCIIKDIATFRNTEETSSLLKGFGTCDEEPSLIWSRDFSFFLTVFDDIFRSFHWVQLRERSWVIVLTLTPTWSTSRYPRQSPDFQTASSDWHRTLPTPIDLGSILTTFSKRILQTTIYSR